jgi:hypothetical protein
MLHSIHSRYKLVLYEDGGFFKPHKDSEKEPGMFASLVVQLPCRHSSGALVVRRPQRNNNHNNNNRRNKGSRGSGDHGGDGAYQRKRQREERVFDFSGAQSERG